MLYDKGRGKLGGGATQVSNNRGGWSGRKPGGSTSGEGNIEVER